ncbi:MAG: hypothetical protein QOG67_3468 [Verrucomicrobiota bacterium]|jgi:DNA-binding NarL/FixJ family response regulator
MRAHRQVDGGQTNARRRVLIVDDHELIREGIAAVIAREPDLLVCGSVGHEHAAANLMERNQPDVVVLDLLLGNRDGIHLLKEFVARFPPTRVLALSILDEEIHAERALRAGAAGYLMKSASAHQLITAVRTVLSGAIYMSARHALLAHGKQMRSSLSDNDTSVGLLSDRELHIFQLIGAGLGTGRIAEELGLSRKTIESYRENIKLKLGYPHAKALSRGATDWVRSMER